MDKVTFVKRFAIRTAIICAVIALVVGLCFGKVVEESLFAEVAKWVVMTVGLLGAIIEPLVIFVIAPLIYKRKYEIK